MHRKAVSTMLKEAAKAAKQSRWKEGQRTGPSIEYTDVFDCTIVLTYKEVMTARYISIVYKIKSNKYCIVNLSAELGLEIEDISAVNIKDTVDKLRKVLMPGYLNIIEMETQLKMKEESKTNGKDNK